MALLSVLQDLEVVLTAGIVHSVCFACKRRTVHTSPSALACTSKLLRHIISAFPISVASTTASLQFGVQL